MSAASSQAKHSTSEEEGSAAEEAWERQKTTSEVLETAGEVRTLPAKGLAVQAEEVEKGIKAERAAGTLVGNAGHEAFRDAKVASREARAGLKAAEGSMVAHVGEVAGAANTALTAYEVYDTSKTCSDAARIDGWQGLKSCAGQAADTAVTVGVAAAGAAESPVAGAFALGYGAGQLGQQAVSAVTGGPTANERWTDFLAKQYSDYKAPSDCAKKFAEGTPQYKDCVEILRH